VRAGYLAVALAVLGSLVVGLIAGWTGARDPGPGPIAVALGLAGPDDPRLDRRRALAVAEATTTCMAALGLSYTAEPESAVTIPDADLDPVAWAARWGFGVSTSIAVPSPSADPDAGRAAADRPGPLGVAEGGRTAAALYGDARTPGCHTKATEAVYGLRERLLAPLHGELASVERAVEGDPAMNEERDRWRACVTPAAATFGASATSVRRDAFVGRLLDAVADRTEQARTSTVGAGTLAHVQALERRVAVSVAMCEAAFATARAHVAAPHEMAFVDRHRADLARIGAAIRLTEASYPRPP
jgi:hypothetical protein